jgi:putative peptidoglycan lipid II flippase
LLGVGVTLGIAVQTFALWPALRRVGFRYRPRFDFRRDELAAVGGMALWTLLYVAVQQVGLVVNSNIAIAAGVRAVNEKIPYGVGLTPWTNAYLLFQLPFGIVSVSLITALLPRMSKHTAEGRMDLRDDMTSGLGLSSTAIIPSAALMFALAPELTTMFFAHGSTRISDALMIANVLQAFAVTLLPFAVFQLLLRVFYALADTRTPALISVINVAISITLSVTGSKVLPVDQIIEGISIALGISWTIGCVIAALLLRRRIGRLGAGRLFRTHLKITMAAVPSLAFAFAVHSLFVAVFYYEPLSSLGALIIGGAGGAALYVLVARRLRVAEVETLYCTVTARLPGHASS